MKLRDLIGKILLAIVLIPCSRVEAGPSLFGSAHQGNLASPAEKQEKAEELTLLSAVDLALRHNPLIRAAISGRKIADGQLSEARAGRLPLLQFSETFTRSNNPVFVFGSLLEQSRFAPQNFDIGLLNSPEPVNNEYLLEQLQPGDVLLVLSAGDADQISAAVFAELKSVEDSHA